MNTVSDMLGRTRSVFGMLALLIIAAVAPVQAQIAEVQLNFPATFPTPFVGEITDELEAEGTRFGQFIFIYTNPLDPKPVEFIFTIDFDGPDGPLLTDIESDPVALPPGVYTYPPFSQGPSSLSFGGLTTDEIMDMIGTDYLTDVVLSGVLAEGNYNVQIRVTSVDGSVPEAIGFTSLQILYPESAVLVAPGDEDEVSAQVPFFQWNAPAVSGGVQLEYEFVLVEMLEGQNPQEAIAGNRAHYDVTFLGQTSFAYTPDLLPLEPGKEYAWQVTTRDAIEPERPFKDEGQSEIYTFVYGSRELGAPIVTAPLRQAEATPDQVRFAWTAPANLPPGYTALDLEYEIVVVEAPDGRTAEEVLLSGARQHALIRVPAGLSTFTYGMLGSTPLIVGQTYAWQLRARDAKGSLEDGLADPRLFTVIASPFVVPEPVIAMSPANGQQLAEVPADLTWSMPATSALTDGTFDVLIVEVPGGEAPEAAFNNGSPDAALLVYQATHVGEALGPSMPVTHGVSSGGLLRDVDEGRTYAWAIGTRYGEDEVVWSAPSSFTVGQDSDLVDIAQVGGSTLMLLGPAEGGVVRVFEPTFQWQPLASNQNEAIDYQVLLVELPPGQEDRPDAIPATSEEMEQRVQNEGYRVALLRAGIAPVGTTAPLSATFEQSDLADSQLLTELRPGRTYAWQVRAGDPNADNGAIMSATRRFTIGASVSAFVLHAPVDGEAVDTVRPTFAWEAAPENVFEAVRYQLVLVEVPLSVAVTDALIPATPEELEALVLAQDYRVTLQDFGELPQGSVGRQEGVFDPPLIDSENALTHLRKGYRYGWQIRAFMGDEGRAMISPTRMFTVSDAVEQLALLAPEENDVVRVFEPTFQWQPLAVNQAQDVEYQVLIVELPDGQEDRPDAIPATPDEMEQRVRNDGYRVTLLRAGVAPSSTVAPLSATFEQGDTPSTEVLTELRPGRTYAWQVRAGDPNEMDGAILSQTRRFTIDASVSDFLVYAPEDGAEIETVTPTFAWEAAPENAFEAVNYQLIVLEVPMETVGGDELIPATSEELIELVEAQGYRVTLQDLGMVPAQTTGRQEAGFVPLASEAEQALTAMRPGYRYVWQIRAFMGDDGRAKVSPTREFTIDTPSDVALISPDEGDEVYNQLSFVFEPVAANATQAVTYQVLLTEWVDGADRATLLGFTSQDIIDSGIPFYRSIHTYAAGEAPGQIEVAFDPIEMQGADYPNKLLNLQDGQRYFWQIRVVYDGYEQDGSVPPSRVFTFRDDTGIIALISPDEGDEVFDDLQFTFESVGANAATEVTYQVLMTEWVEGADRATLLGLDSDEIRASGIPFYRSSHTFPAGEAPEVIEVAFDSEQMEQADYPNKLLKLRDGQDYFWQVRIGYEGYDQGGDVPPNRVFTFRTSGEPGETALADVEALPVVEDVAELVGLDDVTVRRDGEDLVLDGDARLRIRVNGSEEPVEMPVRLRDMRWPSAGLGDQMPSGGDFEANFDEDRFFSNRLGALADWFDFGDFKWSEGEGLNLPLRVRRPGTNEFFGDWEPFDFGLDGLEGLFDFSDTTPDDGQPLFGFSFGNGDSEGFSFGFERFLAEFPGRNASGDGRLRINRPELPECLSLDVPFNNFDLGAEQTEQTIPTNAIGDDGCAVPLNEAESLVLLVERVGADVSTQRDGFVFTADATLNLGGRLQMTAPFVCDDGPAQMEMGETTLALASDGLITGAIDGLVPTCPMQIGPFTAEVIRSTLLFETPESQQAARLTGEARLRFNNDLAVLGTFELDALTGTLLDYRFELDEPFTLGLPFDAPVLSFRFDTAVYDPTGLSITGTHDFLLDGGDPIRVSFDDFTLDLGTFEVVSGSALFADGFGFEVGVTDAGLAFQPVSLGASLDLDMGFLFEMTGALRLDAEGFHANGDTRTQLRWDGIAFDDLGGTFSDDFALDLFPFGVHLGRLDFDLNGTSVAYLDSDGFWPSLQLFDFALPDLLPVPFADIAGLRLKDDDDNWLLDFEQLDNGWFRLSAPGGIGLELPFLGLDAPDLTVRFDLLDIDPLDASLKGGGFTLDLPEGQGLDLSGFGLPFTLTGLSYQLEGELPRFDFFGFPTLFGQGSDGNDEPFAFTLGGDRTLAFDFEWAPGWQIPLVIGSDLAQLDLNLIRADFALPLLQPELADFNYDIDATMQIGGESSDFRFDLGGDFGPGGFSVQPIDLDLELPDFAMDFGPFGLVLRRINRLDALAWGEGEPWTFDLNLDLDFVVDLPDAAFSIPLDGVGLSDDGFTFPRLDLGDLNLPPYSVPAFDFGAVEMQPLAFRLWDWDSGDGWTFDAFNWSEGDDSSFRWPQLDFALRFPGIDAFGDASFTLADVSFERSVFEGMIVPFTFEQSDGAWPTWDFEGFGFDLEGLRGGFSADDDGSQAFDFTLRGFPRFDLFSDADENECPVELTEVRLLPEGGVAGVVDFTPCGIWQIGPVTLGVNSSTLAFGLSESQQLAVLDGNMWATMPNIDADAEPIRATGDLSVDALTGELLDGFVEIENPQWSLGSGFDFRVALARLDPTGLTLNGESDLILGETTVATTFDAAKLDFDGTFVDGEIRITSSFAMDLALSGLDWNTRFPEAPMSEDNTLRLITPNAVTITPDGFTLNGSGSARLRWGDELFDGISIDYGDGFSFGVGPFAPLNGRMTFTYDGSAFAYFDAQEGWGLLLPDFLDQQLIPARIPLPTLDVAFLQVREREDSDLLINLNRDGEGWSLCTSSRDDCRGLDLEVDLVFPSLAGDLEAPRIPVQFSLDLDDAFNVIGGELDVTLDTPFDFSDYGLPLLLRRLRYQQVDGDFALTADADLRLPEWMNGGGENGQGACEVSFDTFSLGSTGEGQSITAGNVYERYEQAMENATPLARCELDGGALLVTVHGAELGVGDAPSRFAGLVRSRYLQAEGEDEPVSLFYEAAFGGDGWALTGSANYLSTAPLGVGTFDPDAENGLLISGTETEFDVELNGVLHLDDLFGSPFALTLREMRFGPNGASIGTTDFGEQEVDLHQDLLKLRLTDLDLDFTDEALMLDLDGLLWLTPYQCENGTCREERAVNFMGLEIGTDGTLALAQADLELLESPIAIIEGEGSAADLLEINSLKLATRAPQNQSAQLLLDVGGAVRLPEPLDAEDTFAMRIGPEGVAGAEVHFRFGNGQRRRGDNAATEVELGSAALFDIMALGVEFGENLAAPAIYANATLYLGDGTGEYVEFGQQRSRGAQAGFYLPMGQQPVWNTTATRVDDFTIADLLEFSDVNVGVQTGDGFAITLGGTVGLNLTGVRGSASWRDLTIGSGGIEDWGRFHNEATFSVLDVMALRVGTLETGSGRLDIGDAVVDTDGYFRFNGAQLTLSDLNVSGGVDEVLYYNGPDGLGFRLRNANLNVMNTVRMNASLIYETHQRGLRMAASGGLDLMGAGQLAFTGAFGKQGHELSMGLFVAAEAEQGIPIVPGIVDITGVGGGLFYNPHPDDLELVTEALGFRRVTPDINADAFALMLYGAADLVGGVLDGQVLVTITDQESSVLAEGSAMGQGNRLEYGMLLRLSYGGGRYGVDGLVNLNVDYPFLLEGEAEVAFAALQQPGQGMIWGVTGSIENFAVTGGAVRADGTIMLGTDGFLLDITVGQSFDFWVIDVRGDFTGAIWYRPEHSMGAYVEIGFRASLFGGAAKVGATAKGALIIEANNDFLIYAAASAYVEVLWVFEGRVGMWISLRNGRFDGGRGPNSEYERMIDEARGQATAMKTAMEDMAAALDEAKNATGLYDFSSAELAQAGWGYYHRQPAGVDPDGVMAQMHDLRRLPTDLNRVKWNVMRRSGGHPANHPRYTSGRAQRVMNIINERTPEVTALADSYEAMALEWNADLQQQIAELAAMTSPVSARASARIEGGIILQAPSFAIDQAQADAQVSGLSDLRTSIAALDSRYFEIYEEATANLTQLQVMLGASDNCFEYEMAQYNGSFTIADMGCHYAFAQQHLSAYFAYEISKAWTWVDYAKHRLDNYMIPYGIHIPAAIQQWVRDEYEPNHTALFELARDHKYYVGRWRAQRHLIGLNTNVAQYNTELTNARSQADAFYNSIVGMTSDDSRRLEIFVALNEYWNGMNRNGLEGIRDEYRDLARDYETARRDRMGNLQAAHGDFTQVLNRIYAIKADMTNTLLGMAESYRGWRREALAPNLQNVRPSALGVSLNAFSEVGVLTLQNLPGQQVRQLVQRNYDQSITNLLNQDISTLRQALQVPAVTSVTATMVPEWRFNRLDIEWDVQHPQDVAEVSFHIQHGDYGDGYARMGTAGALNRLSYYVSRTSENQSQVGVEMVVRARGPAGNTASRRASFNVPLTGATMDDLPPVEGLDGDETPPSKPTVRVAYTKRDGVAWTNRPDQLEMVIESVDYESDIARWQYALTSQIGGTPNVRNWTDAVGEQVLGFSNIAFLGSARLGTAMRELRLQPSRSYFLMARTYNGVGQRSDTGVYNGVIRYDATPPSQPSSAQIDAGGLGPLSSYVWSARPARASWTPTWEGYGIPSMATPRSQAAQVTWTPPIDDESGMRKQMYVLSTQADASAAFEMDAEEVQELSASHGSVNVAHSQLSYTEPRYMHLYGINYAGSMGEALTIPVQPVDESRPIQPVVAARMEGNTIKVYLRRASGDPESGLMGYQYALGSQKGGTDFRPWPESDMDMPVSDQAQHHEWIRGLVNNGQAPPTLTVSSSEIPVDTPFYVTVRALNGQGTSSTLMAVGPFERTPTPPTAPVVSLQRRSGELRISTTDIMDEAAGLSRVEYRVEDLYNPEEVLVDWQEWLVFDPAVNGVSDVETAVPETWSTDRFGVRVRMRAVNTIGLQSVGSKGLVYSSPYATLDADVQTTSGKGSTAEFRISRIATQPEARVRYSLRYNGDVLYENEETAGPGEELVIVRTVDLGQALLDNPSGELKLTAEVRYERFGNLIHRRSLSRRVVIGGPDTPSDKPTQSDQPNSDGKPSVANVSKNGITLQSVAARQGVVVQLTGVTEQNRPSGVMLVIADSDDNIFYREPMALSAEKSGLLEHTLTSELVRQMAAKKPLRVLAELKYGTGLRQKSVILEALIQVTEGNPRDLLGR
ncbi:MAG: hypothetical protein RhofKO_05880 [Rhodothermales bacterium]